MSINQTETIVIKQTNFILIIEMNCWLIFWVLYVQKAECFIVPNRIHLNEMENMQSIQ